MTPTDADRARAKMADAIHSYVFARMGDARAAARLTQDALQSVDRDIDFTRVVPLRPARTLRHVTGDRGGAA